MELTEKYLDTLTLVAEFWVADNDNKIISMRNEGIVIEKSKIYLKKYFIDIILTKEDFTELNLYASEWKHKFPVIVLSKASKRVESYENLKFIKVEERKDYVIIKMAGELGES